MSQNPPKASAQWLGTKYYAIPAETRIGQRNDETQFSIESGRMTANYEAMPRTTRTLQLGQPPKR